MFLQIFHFHNILNKEVVHIEISVNAWEVSVKVHPHLHANTNEAGRGEAYANICLDCNSLPSRWMILFEVPTPGR